MPTYNLSCHIFYFIETNKPLNFYFQEPALPDEGCRRVWPANIARVLRRNFSTCSSSCHGVVKGRISGPLKPGFALPDGQTREQRDAAQLIPYLSYRADQAVCLLNRGVRGDRRERAEVDFQ